MLHLLLLAPLALSADPMTEYQKNGEWAVKKGTNVGKIDLGTCFEAEFDLTPTAKEGAWCNLVRVGANNERQLGVWLYPGDTRLHVRVHTDHNWNEGCDPTVKLPLNKKTNVRISACGKTVIVSVGTEMTKCRLTGVMDFKSGTAKDLWLADNDHAQCKAKMADFEIFRSLKPVVADCAKLQTQHASLKSALEGKKKEAENAIPTHKASQQSHTTNKANIQKVEDKAKTLTSVSRVTVDKLLALLAKLKTEAENGINTATKNEADCKHDVATADAALKQLEVNKFSCDCAKEKDAHEANINKKDQENDDLADKIKEWEKQLEVVKRLASMLGDALAAVKGSPLEAIMSTMYGAQIKYANDTKDQLEKDLAAFRKTISDNNAYIKTHRDAISECDKKLQEARKNMMAIFTAETQWVLDMVEEMDYFENLRMSEIWSHNVNLKAYAAEFSAVPVVESFTTEQDFEGVETQQVSYGLIGGAGVLTSGLFYYAYQRKQSA